MWANPWAAFYAGRICELSRYFVDIIRQHGEKTMTIVKTSAQDALDSEGRIRGLVPHAQFMDDTDIDRLRETIRRSFANLPHKKKYWLALLEMYVAKEKVKRSGSWKTARESAV